MTKVPKSIKVSRSKHFWFFVAVAAAFTAAPHGIAIKQATSAMDVSLVNFFRMTVAIVPCIPVMLQLRLRQKIRKKAIWLLLLASVALAASIYTYSLAIIYSTASYVAILQLLAPIAFVLYSIRYFHEKISARALWGISFAIIGAAIIVMIPYYVSSGSMHRQLYPLASLLMIVNALTYPLFTINVRTLNTKYKLSMFAILGYIYSITAFVAFTIWILTGAHRPSHISMGAVVAIVFSGLVVSGLSRALQVWSYEKVGSVVTAVLTYAEIFVAILLPVLYLGETLSLTSVLGGILILIGVIFVESHKHHARAKQHSSVHRTHA